MQCAYQQDVVNDPVCSEQTSAKLRRYETLCTQLLKQLAAASHSLRLSARGFEAMTSETIQQLISELDSTKRQLASSLAKTDVLTYQKNALAAEIQRLRDDYELAINRPTSHRH